MTTGPRRCAVVLTALAVEYAAVCDALDGDAEQADRGTIYRLGAPRGVRCDWQVAVARIGAGATSAGLHLDRAVLTFAPDLVLFVGVAGGRKATRLGDVVAADIAYEYEHGRSEEHQDRMGTRSFDAHYGTVQQAYRVVHEQKWTARGVHGSPRAFVQPVASGTKVIGHDRSSAARLVADTCDQAYAVDLESGGFLQGAWVNSGLPSLIVRGVSDLLADKDAAHDEVWQPVAAANATAFAVELLDRVGCAGLPPPAPAGEDARDVPVRDGKWQAVRLGGDPGLFGPPSLAPG